MDHRIYYVIACLISNVLTLAIYANYNIKLSKKQAILENQLKELRKELVCLGCKV